MNEAGTGLPSASPGPRAVRKQIRGSSLLLAGRFLSLGLNFLVQVLLARRLSASGFGAFAYALSAVTFCQALAIMGMKTAFSRFVPVYHERGDLERFFGTLLLVLGGILATSAALISVFVFLPGLLARFWWQEHASLAVLSIMIFMVPLQGVETLCLNLLASFGRSRAIFLRRHLLGPAVKLCVVAAMIVMHGDLIFVGYGYLIGSLLSAAVSARLAFKVLRDEGLLARFKLTAVRVPAREVLSFALPIATSELLPHVIFSFDVVLLGAFHPASEVARFCVADALAGSIFIVLLSHTPLYAPALSRLLTQGDEAGMRTLYGRTGLWVAALTFPLFALTFGLSRPLLDILYGGRYPRSSGVLAVIAAGYFCSVALGANEDTLRVLGTRRRIASLDVLVLAVNLALNLSLMPRFGALGAAVALSTTLVFQNLLRIWALRVDWGHAGLATGYASAYGAMGLGALALVGCRAIAAYSYIAAGVLTAAVTLAVLAWLRRDLDLAAMFPELPRLPLLRRWVGEKP